MSSPLAVGKLARLAGADAVMINTPYGGYPLRKQKYMQTMEKLVLPLGNIKPSMPCIGGGVHPGMVAKYISEAGTDIILAAGGSIQGHRMGPAAGAKAMREAIRIAVEGGDFTAKAEQIPELKEAIGRWGYQAP
jgi:2,3-diketo-5-methylthiopentyl-1-phosphate enolase